MHALALRLLFPALLCSLSAADDWVVGPPGGGADFAQIDAAIAVAQPGDTIFVQAGDYEGFTVSRGVRILGDGSQLVFAGEVFVRDLPAGEEVVLSGMNVTFAPFGFNPPPTPALRAEDNDGTVVLHDLVLDIDEGSIAFYSAGLLANNNDRILVMACEIRGIDGSVNSGESGPGVDVTDTSIWISDSLILGGDEAASQELVGAAGISACNSSVVISRSEVRGGSGPFFFENRDGGPGIWADNSGLELVGGPGNLVLGGDAPDFPSACGIGEGGPGLDLRNGSRGLTGSDAEFEGGLDTTGLVQAPDAAVDGLSDLQMLGVRVPNFSATPAQAQLGSSFTLDLAGNPLALDIVYVSLELGPVTAFPGIASVAHLDPATLIRFGQVPLDAQGSGSFTSVVPNVALLMCSPVWLQVLELAPVGNFLTTPNAIAILP